MSLKDLLFKSAPKMYELALNSCTNDYIGDRDNCCWYHCVWQYLRVLNCVSAPQWHEDFYKKYLNFKKGKKDKLHILISGTADFSMLDILVDSFSDYDKEIEIDILDKCLTPLKICDWYCKEVLDSSFSDKIKVNLYQTDLFVYSSEKKYDIICTDAFLTRFSQETAAVVIKKWKSLLKQDGIIITTVRIHSEEECKNVFDLTVDINKFLKKVEERFEKIIKENTSLDIEKKHLLYLSLKYIVKIKSNKVGNEEEIIRLFENNNLKVIAELSEVEGEIHSTQYLRIVSGEKL